MHGKMQLAIRSGLAIRIQNRKRPADSIVGLMPPFDLPQRFGDARGIPAKVQLDSDHHRLRHFDRGKIRVRPNGPRNR
jgi:hypothetical protein